VTRFAYDPRAGLYVGGVDFGLAPPPPAPALDDEALELLVRFEHPAKFLAVLELPGGGRLSDAAVAEAYAIAPARLEAVREGLRAQACAAAEGLLADPELRRAARQFPSGVVVALGDSITDDLVSWVEILRHCLAGRDDVVLVNAGVSGDTTSDALRRLHGVVAVAPDLVITMLGTNDCQRHGPARQRIVPVEATRANLQAIAGWLAGAGAALAWLTPPPVDEAALAAAVGAREFAVRDADTAAAGACMHELGGPVIDVRSLLGGARVAEMLLPDGVHPTLAGQARIAAAVLGTLA
jgi:lysophospholipase L1-like esterase